MANQTKQTKHKSEYTLEEIAGIVSLVDGEKDRSFCKKILQKVTIKDTDVLDVRNHAVSNFLALCDNYGVVVPATIIGKDTREELIQQVKKLSIKTSRNFEVNDYIVSNWLKIDTFLMNLNKLDKGQQHKYMSRLITSLNDQWCATFYHNSNNDCRKLINKMDSLNIKCRIKSMSQFQKKMKYYYKIVGNGKDHRAFVEQYEDQMFSISESIKNVKGMLSMPRKVGEAAETIVETATDLKETIITSGQKFDLFSAKFDKVIMNCELLTGKFLSTMESWDSSETYMSFFMNLIKFVSFAYLAAQKSNQNATNLTALITLILPAGIGNYLLGSLSRAVLGIIGIFAGKNVTSEQIGDETHSTNFASAFLQSIGIMLKSVFSSIDKKAFDTLKANTIFLKTISDLIRSCRTIVDFIIKALTSTLDFIISHIMDYYGMLPDFLRDDDFAKMIDEFVDIKKMDVLSKCDEDIICAQRVIKLRDKVIDLEQRMNKALLRNKDLVYKVAPYIRIIATALDKAYDGIPPQFKGTIHAHRVKPFFVYIYGKPRIGKSKIFQPLLVNALAQAMNLIDEYQDPQHYCHFRTIGKEFWDGGQNKKVIWYNDIFQAKCAESALDLAIDELGAVVDDNPYHMNMSDIKDKSKCYLTSPLVVANGQDDFGAANFVVSRTWSNGEHLKRRRDVNIQLILNPSWMNADEGVDYAKVKSFIKSQPSKCYGAKGMEMFPLDMYTVRFYDCRTNQPMFDMMLEQAIKHICVLAKDYISRQDEVTSRLIKNMESAWVPKPSGGPTNIPNTTAGNSTVDQMYCEEEEDDASCPICYLVFERGITVSDKNAHINQHFEDRLRNPTLPRTTIENVQTDSSSDMSDIERDISEVLRPARKPMLTYEPKISAARKLFRERAVRARKARISELIKREQHLMRPRRAKYCEVRKNQQGEECYLTCEETYAEEDVVVRDGSVKGSFFTYALTDVTCQLISSYLTSMLTTRLTSEIVKPYTTLMAGSMKVIWKTMESNGLMSSALAVTTIQTSLTGMSLWLIYRTNETAWYRFFPYVGWIVQSLLFRNMHRVFNTIEDIIVFGFQNPEYYYDQFINFVYNERDHVLHSIFTVQDWFIDSYYACFEIYQSILDGTLYDELSVKAVRMWNNVIQQSHQTTQKIKQNAKSLVDRVFLLSQTATDSVLTYRQQSLDWLETFARNAYQSFQSTYADIKDFLGRIPGWVYLTMGAALLGGVGYMIYSMFRSNDTTEQSHEGNMKAARRRVARKINKRVTKGTVGEQSYNNTNADIQNITRNCFAYMQMEVQVTEGVWTALPYAGVVLNVFSNIFVLPYHYWYRFHHCNNLYAEQGMKSRLTITWGAKSVTTAYFDSITVCQLEYGHARDVIYIRIKGLCCGKDLRHFFATESDHEKVNLVDTYLYGYRPRGGPDFSTAEVLGLGKTTLIEQTYPTKATIEPIFGSVVPSVTISFENCYQYTDCRTTKGDCNMLFMHTDSKVNAKILGIHTAGNEANHTGISAPIYREDLDEVWEFFSGSDDVISLTVDQIYMNYTEPPNIKSQKYSDQGFCVEANTNVVEVNGKQRRICASLPTKSKISPSVVAECMEDDFGPSKFEPAKLARGKDDAGNIISPFEKAFAKMNNTTKHIEQQFHDDLVESCADAILSWPSMWNKANARLLTWEECINGYMNLKGLDLSTSSGFPYTLESSSKGKWFYKQDEKYIMNDVLLGHVSKMEQMLSNGQIPPVYFVDTLKDETRPKEKVAQFKTRLFQVGSMAWTILFRRYFGWFIGHCQSSYEFGEMMSGINANGYDWDLIARKMTAKGKDHANGDFETYDSTLSHQGSEGCADCANIFYAQGKDSKMAISNKIRKGLILGSINTFHIVEDFVIFRRQGNPSGFLLTTVINNFCNMYYHRYAFVKLTQLSLADFKKYVYCIFFGDDCDATISEEIVEKYNMQTISIVFKELGLKYTSADKKAIETGTRTIEEITFLKRSFFFDEKMRIWRSKLDHDVIMEIARWSESDPNNVADQMNRFNSSLMEIANYGKEQFDNLRMKYKEYIYLLNVKGYDFKIEALFTYGYVMHLLYPLHYPSTKLYDEPAVLSDRSDTVTRREGAERDLCKIPSYTYLSRDEDQVEEQQFIANSQQIQLTTAEMQVIRTRASRCIRDYSKVLQPIYDRTKDYVFGVVNAALPCPMGLEGVRIFLEAGLNEIQLMMVEQRIDEQMMEPQGPDDAVDTNIEQQKTTVFVDTNQMHDADMESTLRVDIDTPFASTSDLSMMNFITRPYIVGTYTWTSTDLFAAQLFSIEFPYVLTSLNNLQQKLSNIAFWAPDIEITIRANTTVFHYGALAFMWVPQGKTINPNIYSLQSTLNSKTWTQLLANARQVLRFTVPYTHYKDKITIGREVVGSSPTREDLFTLVCYVSWPLSTAQSGTVAPVNVQVIARIANPRLSGFTVDNYTPQGWENNLTIIDDDEDLLARTNTPRTVTETKVPKQEEKKHQYHGYKLNYNHLKKRNARTVPQGADGEASARSGGLVSNVLLKAADFLGKFSFIPLVSEVTAPASAITAAAGYVARWMGFSVTPNMECTSSMQVRNVMLMKAEDVPNAVPLAPNSGLVAKDFVKCNSFPTEMSIKYFIDSPGLIYTGEIIATHAPGQILFRRAVSPREMYYGDATVPGPAVATNGIVYGWGHYMLHASTYAKAWRGGIQFYFTPICTQFHSCRIAIVYQPYCKTGNTPTTITLSNFTNALNHVVDIQSGQTHSFVVPYDQCQDFLMNNIDARVGVATNSLTENNGYITIILINELTSVIATPTKIGFQIMARPCDDFQLIGPHVGNANAQTLPQGIDDVEMCDYPASSAGCLAKVKPVYFGKQVGHTVSDLHHSFELTSFKQLMNMHSFVASATLPVSAFTFCMMDGMAAPYVSSSVANPLMLSSQYFRYFRGGTRMSVISENVNLSASACSAVTWAGANDFPAINIPTQLFNQDRATRAPGGDMANNSYSLGLYQTSLASRTPMDVTIPFFSVYKCLPLSTTWGYNNVTSSMVPRTSASFGVIRVTGTAGSTVSYMLSGADDMIFGWVLPSPTYRWSLLAGTPVMPKLLAMNEEVPIPVTVERPETTVVKNFQGKEYSVAKEELAAMFPNIPIYPSRGGNIIGLDQRTHSALIVEVPINMENVVDGDPIEYVWREANKEHPRPKRQLVEEEEEDSDIDEVDTYVNSVL